MFDQLQALEFIKRNILAFRGDPKRITLMGDGAGAVSVGLHLVSPASQNKGYSAVDYDESGWSYDESGW